MNIILFDLPEMRLNLLPLTYTRPIADIRVGILKISEKWENILNSSPSFLSEHYLQNKFPVKYQNKNLYINASVLPTDSLTNELAGLKQNQALVQNNFLLGFNSSAHIKKISLDIMKQFELKEYKETIRTITYPWDIFQLNGLEIEQDYKIVTKNRISAPLSGTNRLIGDNIFIEDGAKIEFATINAEDAYVYIGKEAQIMEGCIIKGSFALGNNAVLKMGAKIYGPTTIGPYSKAGGEINNSVIFAYSSKAHDGYLGNAVLGEWCNLGAGTNNSNLKNNYADVKLWSYKDEKFTNTGLQFCGLIMGDHSKCSISTMFNTGTVVGVNANIYGAGFPRNFVPSFSWGGSLGFKEYKINKAFEVNKIVMQRRNKDFNSIESEILTKVFNLSSIYRRF